MGVTRAASELSARSYARLSADHLARLSVLAAADHGHFTRDGGRPEYGDRRLAVVLAQGAALHYVDHCHGVKDLDVWTFYAAVPGERFPGDKRETHADFGPSELGRQRYDPADARSPEEWVRWQRWQEYEGRRLDFLTRALPVDAGVESRHVVTAIQGWLEAGSCSSAAKKPSAWHLAQKAVVVIDPPRDLGLVIWPL